MYILGVVADSHYYRNMLEKVAERFRDVDAVVHLGDCWRDGEELAALTKKPVHAVRGNCDSVMDGPAEAEFEREGVRVLLTHGDKFQIKYSPFRLNLYAREKNCQLCLYGHTHVADQIDERGVTMVNPGALKYGKYAIVTLDNGIIGVKFYALED